MGVRRCLKCYRVEPSYIADPTCPRGGYCVWLDDTTLPKTPPKRAPRIETRAVLAGAYREKREKQVFLTHSVKVDGSGGPIRTFCGRVKLENLADEQASDPQAAPSCPRCFRSDPRFR